MKRRDKGQRLAVTLLALALSILTATSVASGGEYTVTVSVNPDTIAVGEVSTVTADWATTRNGTTFYQWYVDDVAVGTPVEFTVSTSTPKSGSETYYFTGTTPGDHVVTFAIWHDSYPAQVQRYGEDSATITVTGEEGEWYGETAWAAGTRYVQRGNWATYTPYVADSTVTLYAGQTLVAGTVHFSAVSGGEVTITITLNDGWRFLDAAENVKIQDYAAAPSGNPNPGSFAWKDDADPVQDSFEITVPANSFYGVHVDVERFYSGG